MESVQNQISNLCSNPPQEEEDSERVYKMVFVVNMDLAMGVGKVRWLGSTSQSSVKKNVESC